MSRMRILRSWYPAGSAQRTLALLPVPGRCTLAWLMIALLLISAAGLAGCAATPSQREPLAPGQEPAQWGSSTGQTAGAPPAPAEGPAPPAAPAQSEESQPPLPAWVTPVTNENFASLVARHRPNEMGRVLILEYHHFGDEEERWTRTWDNFRKDLETLYAKGFRAVSLGDYLNGEMALPAGTSPVLFTFDDSPLNQFRMIQQDGQWVPDPRSVPAVMLQFAREHPDFGVAGTFFVKFTNYPFEEEESWKEKLRFLVEHGFEVGNHSYTHDNLAVMDDDGVRRSLGMQVKRVREALPDYDGWTIALPLGEWPKNRTLLLQGEYEGVRYRHRAVLEVADSPVHSPYDRRQKVHALQRTQAIQSEFDRWFIFLDKNRYISDGDPNTIVVPESLMGYLDLEKLQGKQVRTYPDPTN